MEKASVGWHFANCYVTLGATYVKHNQKEINQTYQQPCCCTSSWISIYALLFETWNLHLCFRFICVYLQGVKPFYCDIDNTHIIDINKYQILIHDNYTMVYRNHKYTFTFYNISQRKPAQRLTKMHRKIQNAR